MSAHVRKVLFIASRGDIAGGEKYLLSVLRHLDRSRFYPIVVVPAAGTFATELQARGVEHVLLPANYWWLAPPQEWYPFLSDLPVRVRSLMRLIQDRQVALVHTNSNQVLEGALAARLCGVHHVYLAHIEYQADLPIFQRLPLSQASFGSLMAELSSSVIAVSNQVADSLRADVPADRLSVISNGLEIDDIDQAVAAPGQTFRAQLGLAADDVLVTAVGRIHPDKGFDLLIEAAARVNSAHPAAHFAIVGGTDSQSYRDALERRIAELGLGAHVHLVPFRSDVPALLAQSDLFVLSSRREGHPFVLLEAMACGLPVVATRCGGVAETVAERETGMTVPIGDADALAVAIGVLVADGDMRRRFGAAGSERVRRLFSAPRMVSALEQAYDDLLAVPAARGGAIGIDLMLQCCTEFGHLGAELIAMKERLKRVEHAADLILDNPLVSAARRIRQRVQKTPGPK